MMVALMQKKNVAMIPRDKSQKRVYSLLVIRVGIKYSLLNQVILFHRDSLGVKSEAKT
jgi:hypothetical protein